MFRTFLLLCAAGLSSSAALATSLPISNPDFSAVPIGCGLGYAYQAFGGDCSGPGVPQQDFNGASGFGWTFIPNAGNGLTGPSTLFFPPSFDGLPFTQAAFLQGNNGMLSQTIGGFSAGGSYVLSFYLGSRFFTGPFDGNQTVQALLDGNVIDTWQLTSFTPFTLESAAFTVGTSGAHTLAFIGLESGDHTAFLSHVAITAVPEPTSLLLLGIGAAGLITKRRRANRRPCSQ